MAGLMRLVLGYVNKLLQAEQCSSTGNELLHSQLCPWGAALLQLSLEQLILVAIIPGMCWQAYGKGRMARVLGKVKDGWKGKGNTWL